MHLITCKEYLGAKSGSLLSAVWDIKKGMQMRFGRHYASSGKTAKLVKSPQVTINVAEIVEVRLNARV